MGGCDVFGISSPSKEYLLRQEYPDLEEKWEVCCDHKRNFSEIDKELKKFGIIKRFFNRKEYSHVHSRWIKIKSLCKLAKEEYDMLEKLLWDY